MSVMSRFALSILSILLATALPQPGLALDKYDILSGAFAKIDEHEVCRVVGNSTGKKIMVPTRSAAEWAIGPKAFLRNLPATLSADTCVPIVLSGNGWGRPGPLSSTGHPRRIPGSGGPVTLLTVGTPVGGGTASLSNNEIVYNPGTNFIDLGYLEVRTVTIPWTGVDKYDLPVSGAATMTIKGNWEGRYSVGYSSNSVNSASTTTITSLDANSNFPDAEELSVLRFRNGTFDGAMDFDGITVLNHIVRWAIIIDNSVAARSTYTLGPSAGNPNGDSYSNTLLDAQINAAADFVSAIYGWTGEIKAGKKIGANDDYWSIVSGRTTGGVSVDVYTMNSNLQLVTSVTLETAASRDSLIASIKAIRHAASTNAKVNTALQTFLTDRAASSTAGSTNFLNILVLSPGISDGAAFSTPFNSLNGTATGQFGFEFFAFRSGASNSVINALDSTGISTPLTAATTIRNANIPFPVYMDTYEISTRRATDTVWNDLKNADGSIRQFPFYNIWTSPVGSFYTNRFNMTERSTWSCLTVYCGASDITPTIVTGEVAFNALKSQKNYFWSAYHYRLRPGYLMRNGHFKADYNSAAGRYKGLNLTFFGTYEETVP